MASPSVQTTNDENPSPANPSIASSNVSIARRPLGEVSANAKVAAPSHTPAFLAKPLAGSPLKRSFTAAMEEGGSAGWMYLKKRRSGEIEGLSAAVRETEQRDASSRRVFAEASPTEPNTPTDDNASNNGSSEDRKSFSSLINYDPSSQAQPQLQLQTTTALFKTVSNAELLKLRLRVAMYKVRTSQTDVPFVDLPIPDPARDHRLSVSAAVEEAVAELSREAKEIQERDQECQRLQEQVPTLLPAPLLQPTAYSSRFVYADGEVPSSPPVGMSLDKLSPLPIAAGEETVTPRKGLVELASPSSTRTKLMRPDELELTSSVVKEKVVQGLLGLRNAA